VLQVGVEVSNKVLGVHDVPEVGSKEPPEFLREHPLSHTFLAAENDGDLALTFRMLHSIGHPAEQVL
jgi:hypothetical protein